MKEVSNQHIVKEIVNQGPLDLLKQASEKGFPFALWRLPNDNTFYGIIDLRENSEPEENVEDWPAGFALNLFEDHHPGKPSLIKADILLKWSDNAVKVEQNPILSDAQIERFLSGDVPMQSESYEGAAKNHPDFEKNVEEAVQMIKTGGMSKVVLSRFSEEELPSDFEPFQLFHKATEKYHNAFVYYANSPFHGKWFGATPETLLSIENKKYFSTVSLAGTQKLADDEKPSDVAWTQKEIEEQAMVSRYIIDCFKKIRLREFEENGPKTIKAGNLAHLKTSYHVDMEEVNMPQLGSIMLNLLHPTSAVCGMPLINALNFIKSHEDYDRELYAGFLGPVNIENKINLFVNLRCFKILNKTGRFYAGAGITGDSNPHKEFLETEMKMQTMKKLIFDSK